MLWIFDATDCAIGVYHRHVATLSPSQAYDATTSPSSFVFQPASSGFEVRRFTSFQETAFDNGP